MTSTPFLVALIAGGCSPMERGPDPFREAVQRDGNADPGGVRAAGLVLGVDRIVAGDTTTFTVTGAGANETIHIARTAAGLGAGPCFGTAGTFCLDIAGPVALQGSLVTDDTGSGSLTQTIPEVAPIGSDLWFQAVLPRGSSGLAWLKSDTVEIGVADAPLTVPAMGPGDLVITEIMVDPAAVADADGEWFEVINTSGLDANLDGLTLFDGVNSVTLAGTTFLHAGQVAVFGPEADPSLNGGVVVTRATPSLSLADQWGEIALLNGAVVIDIVAWDDGTSFPLAAGQSLVHTGLDPLANDAGQHWTASDEAYGLGDFGTPGRIRAILEVEASADAPLPRAERERLGRPQRRGGRRHRRGWLRRRPGGGHRRGRGRDRRRRGLPDPWTGGGGPRPQRRRGRPLPRGGQRRRGRAVHRQRRRRQRRWRSRHHRGGQPPRQRPGGGLPDPRPGGRRRRSGERRRPPPRVRLPGPGRLQRGGGRRCQRRWLRRPAGRSLAARHHGLGGGLPGPRPGGRRLRPGRRRRPASSGSKRANMRESASPAPGTSTEMAFSTSSWGPTRTTRTAPTRASPT